MTPEQLRVWEILLSTLVDQDAPYLYGDRWITGRQLAEIVARRITP